MSFNAPQAPPPLIMPEPPSPVAQLQFSPTTQRPRQKAAAPTMLGEALTPGSMNLAPRSLIGAA
jgi:hypothetical protein